MTPEEIAAQYEKTRSNLTDMQNKLQDYTQKVEKDLEVNNSLSKDASEKVDKLLAELSPLQENIRNMEQKLAEQKDTVKNSGVKMSLPEFARNDEEFKRQVQNMVSNGYNGTAKLDINNAVTSIGDADKNIVAPQRYEGIIAPGQMELTVRDLLTWGQTSSNAIEFVRESGFTNNAAFVKENPTNVKPESGINFELDNANVQTLAHWIPASKQILDDINTLTSYLSGRLLNGLGRKEEEALLFGTGVGVEIEGISTQAQSFNTSDLGSLLDTNSTTIDKLRVALLQTSLSDYSADAILLNPIDWARIELMKDKNDNYLFGNPHAATAPALWGKRVVSTRSMTESNFLTGAFAMGAMGWDRENANVRVSTEDRDNFVKNMVTILVEERLGLTVFRPEAFVKGTLS